MGAWSNHDLPPDHQFGAWVERLQRGQHPAGASRLDAVADPFPASIGVRRIGGHDLLAIKAPPHRVELRARDETAGKGYFALNVHAAVVLRTSGRDIDLPAGSLCLVDPQGDEMLESAVGIDYRSICLPRRVMDAYLPASHWPASALPLLQDQPVRSLALSYFAALIDNGPNLTEADADAAMDTLCRLLALGLKGEAAQPAAQHSAVRAARLTRVKRMLLTQLTDPGLSPARFAASVGMSTRSLHLLFSESGETFQSFVTRRRLEACRAALIRPGKAEPGLIADVAFAQGFTNLTTFYRAFRSHFGMTPMEMRAQAETVA